MIEYRFSPEDDELDDYEESAHISVDDDWKKLKDSTVSPDLFRLRRTHR